MFINLGSPQDLENVLCELQETINELETRVTQMSTFIREEKEAVEKAQVNYIVSINMI